MSFPLKLLAWVLTHVSEDRPCRLVCGRGPSAALHFGLVSLGFDDVVVSARRPSCLAPAHGSMRSGPQCPGGMERWSEAVQAATGEVIWLRPLKMGKLGR